MEKRITIQVRLEGYLPQGLRVSLKKGAVLQDLWEELTNNCSDEVRHYFINSQTGEPQIFGAIVNTEFWRLEKGKEKTLLDGDQVLFLSPIGGG